MSVLIFVQTVCKGYQHMTKSSLARKELKELMHMKSAPLTFDVAYGSEITPRIKIYKPQVVY